MECKVKHERTPLCIASIGGHVSAVRYLMGQGADKNAIDDCERSVVFQSAYFGQDATLALLLDGGADIDRPGCHLDTPLMAACRMGNLSTARLLLRRGADIEKVDLNGKTALTWTPRENEEIKKTLREWMGENVK